MVPVSKSLQHKCRGALGWLLVFISALCTDALAAEIILKPTVTTVTGETVIVLGDQAALSSWNKAAGLPCTKAATTSVWTCQTFTLAAGTAYQYKYAKRDSSGVVTYEGGSNRSRVAPTVATQYSESWGVAGGTSTVVASSGSTQSSSIAAVSSSSSSSLSSSVSSSSRQSSSIAVVSSSISSSPRSSSSQSSSIASSRSSSSSISSSSVQSSSLAVSSSSSSLSSSSRSSVASSSVTSSSAAPAPIQIILKPTVTTVTGETVIVLGDQAALSSWNKAAGLPCTKAATTWEWTCQAFTLAAGTTYNYKYAKRSSSGVVTYEGGSNRVRVAPAVSTQYSESWGVAGGTATVIVASSSVSSSSVAATSSSMISSISSSSVRSLSSAVMSSSSSSSSSVVAVVAPAIPTSITPQLNGASVNLSWTASTGATFYEVRKVVGGVEENVSLTSLLASATTVTATELNIATGKTYLYRVRACTSSGAITACSGWRDSATSLIVAPKIPASVTATLNGTLVNLSWGQSDQGSTYEVQKNTASFITTTITTTINVLTATDTLTTSGSYSYRVRACIGASCSEWQNSNALNIAPATPTYIDAKINDATVTVSWAASAGATTYQLYRDGELLASESANTFSDIFKEKPAFVILHGGIATPIQYGIAVPAGMRVGQTYTYSVVACSAGGCSASKSISITPPPATVSALTLASLDTWYTTGIFARVSWAPSAGATSYELWRNGVKIYAGAEPAFNTLWPNISIDDYTIRACVGIVCSAPTSTTPSITNINDQVVDANASTGALTFTIADADTATASLIVTAASSNQALIPQSNILLSGSGSSRAISLAPVNDASGASTISVTVSDGVKSSTDTFIVSVKKEPIKPQEITTSNYDIYCGDLNGDGKSDYYFHGKQQLILLHGDVAVPLILTAPSFVIYSSDAEPKYSKPELLRLSSAQLAAKIAANHLRLAQLNVDYFIWTDGVTGQSSVLLRGADATIPSLQLTSSVAEPLPTIAQIFQVYNRTANISDRTFAITISDTNADGRKDITVNGAKYQSQATGVISATAAGATAATAIATSDGLTNGIVNSPVPMEVTANELVGTLAGEFRVNESGAATYNDPITVADGIAGVTPRINIGYSSQGGNGVLGKGWALGGLSAISRCRQTLSQDGAAKPIAWTAEDRFCLDGQRLMLVTGTYGVAGSTYKTEIDTFVTVTAIGGTSGNPDSFEARAKDGSVTTYGGNDLAKVKNGGSVLSWSISYFADNVGNGISYTYENKLSHHVITQIDYAYVSPSAPSAKVVFTYDTRLDQSRGYIAGLEVFNTQRLKNITSYNGSAVVRSYRIGYDYAPERIGGYSRVTSVQECADVDTTSRLKCYKPTEFTWYAPNTLHLFDKGFGSIWHDGGRVTVTSQAFLDINGNGIQDYIWSDESGAIKYTLDSSIISNTTAVWLDGVGGGDAPKFEPIDYNGDGRQDLLIYRPNENKWVLYLSIRTGTGWGLARKNIALPFASYKDIKVGDVNSDGLADVIGLQDWVNDIAIFKLQKMDGAPVTSNLYYHFGAGRVVTVSESLNFKVRTDVVAMGDMNGDGKVDLAVKFVLSNIYRLRLFSDIESGSSNFIDLAFASGELKQLHTPDLNGDGLADIVYLADSTWTYKINNGMGFNAAESLFVDNEKAKDQRLSFADINHDGFTDVSWADDAYSGSFAVYVKYWNSATAKFNAISTIPFSDPLDSNYTYSFMDVNGDGWLDRVATALYGKNTSSLFNVRGFAAAANYSDDGFVPQAHITNINNGLGARTKIDYEPIGRSKNYFPIGDIKVSSETKTICTPYIYDGQRMIATPGNCTPVTSWNIDTDTFYKLINDPFGSLPNAADVVPAPVLEVMGPVSVVTKVDSSAPIATNNAALSSVIYSYKHLRMQAAGRGMLGFASLATLDAQTGITTETTYRQDWPYIGSPSQTIVKTADGKIISKATNVWDRRAPIGKRRYQPYIKESVEQAFALNTDATGAIVSGSTIDAAGNINGSPLQVVTTTTKMMEDDYGNVDTITVATVGGADTLVKITDNDYFGDEWRDRMGRLKSSETTATLNGVTDPVHKKVRFDYYPQGSIENGLLKQEVILDDANNPYLTTNYKYDDKGNKKEVSVTGLAETGREETRTTTYSYDTAGRYLVATTNDLNQSSSIIARSPITGQPIKVADINQVQSQVFYDAMGKEYLRIDDTGAWSRSDTIFCIASSGCPAGAKFYTWTRVAGGGASTSYYDMMGRVIRNSKIGFDGTAIYVDTEYDNLGRTKRQSEPYFAGQQPAAWTTNTYDILGRVTAVTLPDDSVSANTYSANTITITNALGHNRVETRNGLGQLVQVRDHLDGVINYTYTINGALKTAATKSPDHPADVVVRMCYDFLERKTGMLDPDKGGWLANNTDCSALTGAATGWWKYNYNAFGELINQRDAKGQITSMTYDKLGRMIKRQDEDQTRWFYDKYLDGSSTPGSQGKLMDVVVRKNTSEVTSYLANDHYTHYSYDNFGRNTDTLVLFPNESAGYITSVKYDSIGRAYETRDALNGAVFNDSGVQTQYNQFGYARRTVDIAPVLGYAAEISRINRTNARGQILEEARNSGELIVRNTYNDKTGLLETQKASGILAATLGFQPTIQDQTYGWDSLGNLKYRINKNANVGSTANKNIAESFCYDGLNRLTTVVKNVAALNPACGTEDFKYDGLGNITYKKDIGNYRYGDVDGGAGPHAVTSITQGSTVERFKYDANGNMVQDNQRTLTYTSYDMVKSISKSINSTSFSYGADRARWQRVDVKNGITTTTTYLGNIERIQKSGSNEIEWKRYVGPVIFTYKTNTNNQLLVNGINKVLVFSDHLGSVDVITDGHGKVLNSLSFDPWGARRDGENWGALSEAQRLAALKVGTGFMFTQPVTNRGFTGHEMVDDMGIIHMNGRIYDAKIGRFLQADPLIDGVGNTQGYNRYSYIKNNPLNGTDPTGFSAWTKFRDKVLKPIVIAVVAYYTFGYALGAMSGTTIGVSSCSVSYAVGGVAINATTAYAIAGGVAGFVSGTAGASLYGASAKDALRAGGKAAVSGALFGGVTGFYSDTWNTGRVLANGVAGGVSSDMNGGSFKEGFKLSAALSVARSYYNKTMKYDVTWEKGSQLANEDGRYVESFGVGETDQVFGTNDKPLTGDFWSDFGKQGGALSNAANYIPGMNSLARLHDQYQIGFGSPDGWMRTWFNVPAMIPATLANYSALIETIPAYPMLLDSSWNSQRPNN